MRQKRVVVEGLCELLGTGWRRSGYGVGPVVIDGCLQGAGAVLMQSGRRGSAGYVPSGVRAVEVYGEGTTGVRDGEVVFGLVRVESVDEGGGVVVMDVEIVRESGAVLMRLGGFELRQLSGVEPGQGESWQELMYRWEWQWSAEADTRGVAKSSCGFVKMMEEWEAVQESGVESEGGKEAVSEVVRVMQGELRRECIGMWWQQLRRLLEGVGLWVECSVWSRRLSLWL